jgi:hypothetical protein
MIVVAYAECIKVMRSFLAKFRRLKWATARCAPVFGSMIRLAQIFVPASSRSEAHIRVTNALELISSVTVFLENGLLMRKARVFRTESHDAQAHESLKRASPRCMLEEGLLS